MSVTHSITNYSGLYAAGAAGCIGFAAIWSNPKRRINRIFFTASLHVALWLVFRHFASTREDLFFYRITTAIGALTHFHLWLVKETVIHSGERFLRKIFRGRWWLLLAITLASICFLEWFIPTPSGEHITPEHRHGFGFYVYLVGLFLLFSSLYIETVRQTRSQSGVQRIEMQLLLMGGSTTAIAVIALMVARAVSNISWLSLISPYIVLLFYAVTVIAITTSRVFDARQLFLVLLHKLCLIGLIALTAFLVAQLLAGILPTTLAFLVTVSMSLWSSTLFSNWLHRIFRYYPNGSTAKQAALLIAQQERRVANLENAFSNLLKGWGQTDRTLLISCARHQPSEPSNTAQANTSLFEAMRHLRWATPERIVRERRTNDGSTVSKFLEDNELGVLILEDGLTLSSLIGVGVSASRRPYTFPEVSQLTELSSIIGGALERAHFTAKVQHTEQLATVGLLGASLAHEIRNPLVSIKTFVQLLPTHYQDASFRDKFFRLITDEVGRIDQLTDQLLDLASPRVYSPQSIALHTLLQSSIDLVTAKAAHKHVELITEFRASPDQVFIDASAAKQVIINLCFNAIQAIDNEKATERWIKVATCNTERGIEMVIADSGPGISPEIRPLLFQPFQTTKSTGFGLGLAICRDILANINANISVDPPKLGHGATFRVTFPCRP